MFTDFTLATCSSPDTSFLKVTVTTVSYTAVQTPVSLK